MHAYVTAEQGNHNKTFTHPSEMSEVDWSDPEELKRTWTSALVRIPNQNGGFISTTIGKLSGKKEYNSLFPTVIYLHGCSGVWRGTYLRADFFAESGFAVIAPVSFARKKYPQSCDPFTYKAGMYRDTLKMRQFDAGYAIENAKKLNWVDKKNIFLIGLSQGGITTATFSSAKESMSVRARVIEGWTCHAGWEEYKGVHAPANEPVLTLVGKYDPWFQNPWTRGDCGKFLNKQNGSKSIIFKNGHLSKRHELLEYKEVQQIVLDFLKNNLVQ